MHINCIKVDSIKNIVIFNILTAAEKINKPIESSMRVVVLILFYNYKHYRKIEKSANEKPFVNDDNNYT